MASVLWIERGTSQEGNRPMWVACLTPKAIVTFGSGILPRAMSGSVTLPQPRVLVDVHGFCYH